MFNEVIQLICDAKDVAISAITLLLAWYARCTFLVQKSILENPKPVTRTSICNLLSYKGAVSGQFWAQFPYTVVFSLLVVGTVWVDIIALFSTIVSLCISIKVLVNNEKIATRLNQESQTEGIF